jgi:hypothetical protein
MRFTASSPMLAPTSAKPAAKRAVYGADELLIELDA